MSRALLTIGHSSHSYEHLFELLASHDVTAIVDVRSKPYSRYTPQFDREVLRAALVDSGISYEFLGRELGARSEDTSCYVDRRVQYELLARTALFQEGLERVEELIGTDRVALMCAEKDPLECHRTILVSRHLVARGAAVEHILADGAVEAHDVALSRLLRNLKLPEADLFRSRVDVVEEAYRRQGKRIAYRLDDPVEAVRE